MYKDALLNKIIATLTTDLTILTEAAKTAHAAATHAECVPDNKYDTTGLEASYVAQGQANRAQAIRKSLESFRSLTLREFDDDTPIRLTALVTIKADSGQYRRIFLGPDAGGLKVSVGGEECTVISHGSPLGRALLGKVCGDDVQVGGDAGQKNYTIMGVS